jgi:hypothetical protein
MDISKSIVGFRESKYVFYAMNKSVIKGNSQHNHPNGAIGKYVNVHRLVVDPTTMKCCCSCSRKAQNGRPCVHMCVIVPVFGPQMFSPRWYKSWNSDLFENQKINGVLTAMRKTHEGSSRGWCPIDCLWENTEFKNVEYINGCDANIEKVMRAITKVKESSETICKAIQQKFHFCQMSSRSRRFSKLRISSLSCFTHSIDTPIKLNCPGHLPNTTKIYTAMKLHILNQVVNRSK